MTVVHYGRALGRLADIYHEEKREMADMGLVNVTRAPVLYDSRFRELCQVVLRQSRHMDNDLYLDVLDALYHLRVPLKSTLTYTYLAQAEQRINAFSAAELAKFAGILNKYDQTNPRVGALMSAVGILTPRHIQNLQTLPQVLHLVNTVGTMLDGLARGKLANMMLAILAADEERTIEDVTHSVLALHKMDYKLDMLLGLASAVLTHSIQELSSNDLHRVLCAFGGLHHRDHDFFQVASECILENIDHWKVRWLIDAADACRAVEFQAPLLLDCIIRRVLDRKAVDIGLIDFTKLVRSLADLGHRPPASWDFEDYILRTSSLLVADVFKLSSADCQTLLTLAHSLAVLGYYPGDLLDFVASRKYANWVMMVKDKREFQEMLSNINSLNLLLKDSKQEADGMWTESLQKLIPLP